MLEFWSGFIFYLMVDIRISWSKSHKKQSKEKRINLPPKPNRRKRESKPEAQTLVTARNHIWTRRNRWCTEQQTEELIPRKTTISRPPTWFYDRPERILTLKTSCDGDTSCQRRRVHRRENVTMVTWWHHHCNKWFVPLSKTNFHAHFQPQSLWHHVFTFKLELNLFFQKWKSNEW